MGFLVTCQARGLTPEIAVVAVICAGCSKKEAGKRLEIAWLTGVGRSGQGLRSFGSQA
jgi:hypothetical protein